MNVKTCFLRRNNTTKIFKQIAKLKCGMTSEYLGCPSAAKWIKKVIQNRELVHQNRKLTTCA
jgi:hypothetical protein